MEALTDGMQYLADFLSGGSDLSLWDHIQAKIIIWWLQIKIFAVQHAWGVAQAVIQQLEISSAINSAWSGIDGNIAGVFSTFRIPEAVNILIQAHVTRLVLNFMGV